MCFFDGERVARRDGPTGTGGVFYYFSDHLKTASVITDSAGVIKAESDYYPWGGELQFVNNDSNDYKFTGKKRDVETGLDYFGARYYSNGLGRWVSADWSSTPVPVPYANFGDPQSLNLYGYVRNIPSTSVDPDGHTCWSCLEWVGAKVNQAIDAVKRYSDGVDQRNAAWHAQMRKDLGDDGVMRYQAAMGVLAHALGSVNSPPTGSGLKPSVNPAADTPAPARLPQDVNVNSKAPAANNGNGTVGPSATQNAAAQADAGAARAAGHTDIRMNQQQVNAQGERVGVNRPDLQSTDINGVRHYTEYDRSPQNAATHHVRTQANDPNGVTHTKVGQ